MTFLETLAADHAIHTVNLETGLLNTQAVKLYKSLGYTVCGPFGAYEDNPYSLFMTKPLATASSGLRATFPVRGEAGANASAEGKAEPISTDTDTTN